MIRIFLNISSLKYSIIFKSIYENTSENNNQATKLSNVSDKLGGQIQLNVEHKRELKVYQGSLKYED